MAVTQRITIFAIHYITELSHVGELREIRAVKGQIFVPFILFFNLLSEIRNKAKGQTLRFIFVTDDRLTLVYITFMK